MPPTDPHRPDHPSRRQAHRVFTWAALGGLLRPDRGQASTADDRRPCHVSRYPILLDGEFALQFAGPDSPLCNHRGFGAYGEHNGPGEFRLLPIDARNPGPLDCLGTPGVHTATGTFFALDLLARFEFSPTGGPASLRPWLTLSEVGGPGLFHLISLDDLA